MNGDDRPGYPPPVVPFAEPAKRMTDTLYTIRQSAAVTAAVYAKYGSRKKEQSFRPKKAKKPAAPPTPSLFDDWDAYESAAG